MGYLESSNSNQFFSNNQRTDKQYGEFDDYQKSNQRNDYKRSRDDYQGYNQPVKLANQEKTNSQAQQYVGQNYLSNDMNADPNSFYSKKEASHSNNMNVNAKPFVSKNKGSNDKRGNFNNFAQFD